MSKNVSDFYFLGACVSKIMDFDRGANCANLLNVFLKIVNPLNFGEFSPFLFKPFAPDNFVEGLGRGFRIMNNLIKIS